MADREKIKFFLPSGEPIIADIPAGMSDAEAKVYMLSKRPDLFASKGKPLPGLAGPAQPTPPQMQMSNTAQALNPTQSIAGPGEASYVAEADPESQSRMLAAAAIGAGGTLAPAALSKMLPPMVAGLKRLSGWINQSRTNQLIAYAVYHELRQHFGKTVKFIKGLPDIPDE